VAKLRVSKNAFIILNRAVPKITVEITPGLKKYRIFRCPKLLESSFRIFLEKIYTVLTPELLHKNDKV